MDGMNDVTRLPLWLRAPQVVGRQPPKPGAREYEFHVGLVGQRWILLTLDKVGLCANRLPFIAIEEDFALSAPVRVPLAFRSISFAFVQSLDIAFRNLEDHTPHPVAFFGHYISDAATSLR